MDSEPELSGWLIMRVELSVVEGSTGRVLPCVVEGSSGDESSRELRVTADGLTELVGEGYDFEEALQVLRARLEDRGLLLLCNRFRRDALVTPLSRQMSGGLSCYLVRPRVDLDPKRLVECLGPADRSLVVTTSEAEAFLANWKAWFEKPALLRWIGRSFR
jgi:hypothetical protein